MAKTEVLSQKLKYYIGIAMALFHIIVLNFYPLSASAFRTTHLLFVLLLVFLAYPSFDRTERSDRIYIGNIVMILLSIATMVYAFFELENILTRGGIWTTKGDIIFGILAILVVLEGTRRTNGPALPLIAIVFILYAVFGEYIPGTLGHPGYSIKRLITSLYSYEGIFGTALAVAATYVVIFVIFAAFFEKSGSGDVFMDLSKSIAGGLRGGPAKIAVIACALFGTISGSAVASVAATGSIIIPLMVKMNYDRTISGATVSAASIGGQIMPPVMAAGAFLMAEFLGIRYVDVIKAATIPALMYFFTIWISLDSTAGKLGWASLNKDEIPKVSTVLRKEGLILIPLVILTVMLVVFKFSPIKCAFYSMVSIIVVCMFDKRHRMSIKDMMDALASSANSIAPTACACACAGIVIGVIGLTGLGMKVSTIIISFSGGKVIFALLLSMVTAIIFGMGLPTTVSYLLCVSVLAPVLINMGILPLAAHMFIFYFACLSGITPPVALAAYTAAGIAGTGPLKTATEGSKLAIIAFFVPYMFVFNTAYLMQGDMKSILWALLIGIATCYSIAAVVQGWLITRLGKMFRFGFLVTTVLLFVQNRIFDLVGLAAFTALIVSLFVMRNMQAKEDIEALS